MQSTRSEVAVMAGMEMAGGMEAGGRTLLARRAASAETARPPCDSSPHLPAWFCQSSISKGTSSQVRTFPDSLSRQTACRQTMAREVVSSRPVGSPFTAVPRRPKYADRGALSLPVTRRFRPSPFSRRPLMAVAKQHNIKTIAGADQRATGF